MDSLEFQPARSSIYNIPGVPVANSASTLKPFLACIRLGLQQALNASNRSVYNAAYLPKYFVYRLMRKYRITLGDNITHPPPRTNLKPGFLDNGEESENV